MMVLVNLRCAVFRWDALNLLWTALTRAELSIIAKVLRSGFCRWNLPSYVLSPVRGNATIPALSTALIAININH